MVARSILLNPAMYQMWLRRSEAFQLTLHEQKGNEMKAFLISLMLAFLYPYAACAYEIPQKVDEKLAIKLAHLATGAPINHIFIDNPDGFDDPVHPFIIYQLIGDHDGTEGWFAINPWTGDVWNIMAGDNCIHYDTPALGKELTKIRARFTKAELREYTRLSELRPGRISDLEPCGSPGGS